jgi:hypothetical protein
MKYSDGYRAILANPSKSSARTLEPAVLWDMQAITMLTLRQLRNSLTYEYVYEGVPRVHALHRLVMSFIASLTDEVELCRREDAGEIERRSGSDDWSGRSWTPDGERPPEEDIVAVKAELVERVARERAKIAAQE